MLRRWLTELDRTTGNSLRRIAGRRVSAGRVVSLGDKRDSLPGIAGYTILQSRQMVMLEEGRLCDFLARQTAIPNDGCSFQTEEVFLATLGNVMFDPHSGGVWTAAGALLLDSIKNAGRLKHVAGNPVAPGTLPGLYSSIAGPISSNTFHWLIESLPRLYSLAQMAEPVTLLMPDTLNASRRRELAWCLPPNITTRFVPPKARLRLERFVLPSFLTTQWDFAYPPFEHLVYVRDKFYAAFGLPATPARRERIYVSRSRARVRRVTNEDEILEVLQPFGFRSYFLEDLPFAEQVRLFHDAEFIIAPHGAGLANLLFAGRIPVLEFISRAVTPVYFFLALALGQEYRYLYPKELGADDRPPAPTAGRLYSATRDLDISIDPAALDAALDEWRSSRPSGLRG